MGTDKISSKKLNQKREFEKVSCNLCGSPEYIVIYPAQYDKEKDKDVVYKFRASGDELLVDQLVKCAKCGLIYVSPRLKGSTIVEAYSAGDDPLFVSQAAARERTFYKALEKIESFVPRKGKILDIGTAGGSFLSAAKKRGWEVYGCEPNKWLAAWGKKQYGIDIKPGQVFDQKYKKDFFDVVTLWDVIEHTPDPLAVLNETSRILKEGGILVVNYPDIGSWISRLMRRKWLFLTSVHLYYFTRKTMRSMLNKAGYEIVKIGPHFQSLELDYVLFRGETYSKALSSLGKFAARITGLGKREVPYWLGQTFIIARKRKSN